jgi:DNA-binding CsgD family transcriptional regulator/tetratricopeptide (TPR) repeat protein
MTAVQSTMHTGGPSMQKATAVHMEVGEPMTWAQTVDEGRKSFGRQAWADAYAQLSAAADESPLDIADLERLAAAAFLIGLDKASEDLWARSYRESLHLHDAARAARCAFWLAFGLLNRGELARGGGWVTRAQRLLDDGNHDCVEQGYLRYLVGMRAIFEGDSANAEIAFREAAEIGDHFSEPDLVALARHGQGRALVRLGETIGGMALLDEVMVAVAAGEVSAIVVGDVYCSTIEACQEFFDLRRAQEWTAALSHWCQSQPDLVPYRGQCLARQAEILQLHGAWPEAMDHAQRAYNRLSQPTTQPGVGLALYQQGELYRLRGDFVKAEDAYRRAIQSGQEPQPGLALVRLAQGRVETAAAAIRRAVDESRDPVTRSKLLAARAEIMLAAGDVQDARAAADELSAIAAEIGTVFLHAVAAQITGAVLLGEGDARGACAALRRALTTWHQLEAPYEAARVRVLIGLACRALGDDDTAEMEWDAARHVFKQLGAAPYLARVNALTRQPHARPLGGLTARQVEVLRCVAAGKTNRAIAIQLCLSEKTVARHISDIFTKLNLSSRAAATAYAYEHDLVEQST